MPAASKSLQVSPAPNRSNVSSPQTTIKKEVELAQTKAPEPTENRDAQTDEPIEPDDFEADTYSESGLGNDFLDTTSISSSIYAGHVENGRRYQTVREGGYYGPSDEKQFEALEAVHITHLILDCQRENPLFYSPIPKTAQNILDIGTGTGAWAKEVADRYPSAVVLGTDLYPPPDAWVPPNCKFEVDDMVKEWDYQQTKFDLIHLRWLNGSFTDEQWRLLYKQAYKNMIPGGYIEQVEPSVTDPRFFCDDGSLPKDSTLANWGPMFTSIGIKSGKGIDTVDTFKARIENAGFVNLREKVYKVPVGEWTRNPILKEAGKFNKAHLLAGIEGYVLYLLTKFGEPQPWSPEDVQILLARATAEMNNPRYHTYFIFRRVWAQKPVAAKANEDVGKVAE